jgi:SnoaL-like domain
MTADDLEVANQFRAALEAAVRTGDLEAVYPLLAADVEWVTPLRTFRGIDEIKDWLNRNPPSETFDYEFVEGAWMDMGNGRIACEIHEVHAFRATGNFGWARERRVELAVGDGKIKRYETKIIG